jgi:hypothetical protein
MSNVRFLACARLSPRLPLGMTKVVPLGKGEAAGAREGLPYTVFDAQPIITLIQ